jgi:adenosylcobinamide-phosphate synthase
MTLTEHLILILAACLLDMLIGDPVYRLHPIRLIGAWSLAWERWLFDHGLTGRGAGLLHWLIVVGGALASWWLVRRGLALIHPWAAFAWDIFVAYSLLCTRDLLDHGRRVLSALGDLPRARAALGMMVGRDTAHLDRGGIVRATIESLSENLTDGVLTPLWALCLLGLPGLILVKAVSSLDSMIGYRNARYGRFGWAAARSDDLVHWLPARLSVPLIAGAAALLRLDARSAVQAARCYHHHLPSPNSGWSEAACAGALRIRLAGPARYAGIPRIQPFIGDPSWPTDLDASDLHRALRLILVCALLALMLGLLMAPARLLLPW